MAEADHDQSACDLLMTAINAPDLEELRANALDAGILVLVSTLQDRNADLTTRATAALALGGELAPGQRFREPAAVFHALDVGSRSPHVVASSHAAWRASRNPMALLLPLVWESWMASERGPVRDDVLKPTALIGGVPYVAVDQFTRAGGGVIRGLTKSAGAALVSALRTVPGVRGDCLWVCSREDSRLHRWLRPQKGAVGLRGAARGGRWPTRSRLHFVAPYHTYWTGIVSRRHRLPGGWQSPDLEL